MFTCGHIHSGAGASVTAHAVHKPHIKVDFELQKMPFACFYNGVNFKPAYRKIP